MEKPFNKNESKIFHIFEKIFFITLSLLFSFMILYCIFDFETIASFIMYFALALFFELHFLILFMLEYIFRNN